MCLKFTLIKCEKLAYTESKFKRGKRHSSPQTTKKASLLQAMSWGFWGAHSGLLDLYFTSPQILSKGFQSSYIQLVLLGALLGPLWAHLAL